MRHQFEERQPKLRDNLDYTILVHVRAAKHLTLLFPFDRRPVVGSILDVFATLGKNYGVQLFDRL